MEVKLTDEEVMQLSVALGYACDRYRECRNAMNEIGGQWGEVAATFEIQINNAISLQRRLIDSDAVTLTTLEEQGA